MRLKIIIGTIIFILVLSKLCAQEISSLEFIDHLVIPFGKTIADSNFGGLSGITYNANDSLYYVVADKPPSRIYKLKISTNDILMVKFKEVLYLSPRLQSHSELEGITFNYKTGNFYVTDEQSSGTRILEIDKQADFMRIVKPINEGFLPLSGHNSGIEGLTISSDANNLYYAFERPAEECLEQSHVSIGHINLHTGKSQNFYYQLHEVVDDKIKTNGISEILYLNDSSLLVMERAYIPNQGNVVRLYQAKLASSAITDKELECNDISLTALESALLFDFTDVNDLKIDNAEGMVFNDDKRLLVIVTDNNFSKRQETQIIVLKVNWR